MSFHDAVVKLDAAVFDTLADAATLDDQPVLGMFEQVVAHPKIGTLNTGLIEPRLVLRAADAQAAVRGSVVVVDLPAPDGGAYDVVDIEPDGGGLVALILRPQA
ncbi:hypothetical protein HA520_10455 [Azotobacter chroococcum]|uniref:Uncharacterized protein n=1 Tax=Azotobacter chroococcum TaxID=353 RepID=A0AA43Z6R4_9GAMM|nr:hypothetical protein [Azotobacter chroococcum]NHN77700.1 hypothetical protein [Azotobacter chroococcum]